MRIKFAKRTVIIIKPKNRKNSKMSEKLYEIMSGVMTTPVSEINDESSPETIEKWNSFRGLFMMNKIEVEFGVKFTIGELTDIKNVGDIKRLLREKGVQI